MTYAQYRWFELPEWKYSISSSASGMLFSVRNTATFAEYESTCTIEDLRKQVKLFEFKAGSEEVAFSRCANEISPYDGGVLIKWVFRWPFGEEDVVILVKKKKYDGESDAMVIMRETMNGMAEKIKVLTDRVNKIELEMKSTQIETAKIASLERFMPLALESSVIRIVEEPEYIELLTSTGVNLMTHSDIHRLMAYFITTALPDYINKTTFKPKIEFCILIRNINCTFQTSLQDFVENKNHWARQLLYMGYRLDEDIEPQLVGFPYISHMNNGKKKVSPLYTLVYRVVNAGGEDKDNARMLKFQSVMQILLPSVNLNKVYPGYGTVFDWLIRYVATSPDNVMARSVLGHLQHISK